jgi:transposase
MGTTCLRTFPGYIGSTAADAAAKAGVTVDIVFGPKPGRGFIVQPRRRVVARTNDWINRCRRLDRHYEVTLAAHEGFLILSRSPSCSDDSTAPSCSTRFRFSRSG